MILIDTHVWIWYVNGNRELQKETRKIISKALYDNEAYLAVISLWEICMLDKKQRIILEMPCLEWINKFITLTHIQIASITPAIAMESCHLPGKFHDDPADRMITATARVNGLTLLTRDAQILTYSQHNYISAIKA
ncbi:MAG TPA: type II toxin-antitoxin system VapC family toxin [Gammaproteobacteria bacterium]|nr:type II toxin-antitoxin system VapC family toxin [Gammaproteobacteria bacterium]